MAIDASLIEAEFSEISSTFFNAAYMGPSPARARKSALQALQVQVDPSFYPHETWRPVSDRLRSRIAELLGVDANNVAHSTSVTEIVSQVTLGFPFRPGDRVVVMEGDYPSNVLPWMLNGPRMGYELVFLDAGCFEDPNRLLRKLPERTRLLNVSHVMFNTGRRANLAEIGRLLRNRGVFFVVDASQSFGGIEISREDLQYVDVLACVTYKWLLGGYGHAFAWYSDRALQLLARTHASWLASPNSADTTDLLRYTTETIAGARKFDRGQAPNMLLMALLEGGLDLIGEVGIREIDAHNRDLAEYFVSHYPRHKYRLVTPEPLTHIVCLQGNADDADALAIRLRESNIDASVREGNLRLSFHFFNTRTQVESLLRAL